MRELFTVFSYTFKENMRKKSFIISTIIMLVLTIALLSIPGIMNHFSSNKNNTQTTQQAANGHGNQQEKKGTIYVIDPEGIFKDSLESLSQTSEYTFKPEVSDNLNKLKEQVKTEKDALLLIVSKNDGIPSFEFYIKQYGSGPNPDGISRTLKSIFNMSLLKAANIPDDTSRIVLSDASYKINELGKGMMRSYLSGFLITILLFFAIYFYGYSVSMSVASEKTSRVMELLITSTKPAKIVLGKSIAMGLLGLCQLAVIVISAVATYKFTFPTNFTLQGQKLDFSNFTPFILLMMIVYFILGYALYAMLNAVAGATVSKAEDVHSANMPISMISLAAFYFAYGTLLIPDSKLAAVASIVPFSAPFSMPCRLLMTEVPAWQIIISLLSVTATTVLIAWISIKLYSAAVLHYGSRLKLKELFKMSKKSI